MYLFTSYRLSEKTGNTFINKSQSFYGLNFMSSLTLQNELLWQMMLLLKIPMESSNHSYLIFEILIKLFCKFIFKKIECWPKIFYGNLHNISYPIEIKITTISICADCIQASGE